MFLHKYYDCVGPGWKPILEALDNRFQWIAEKSQVRCELHILQVKEKFGGLRVYIDARSFTEEDRRLLHALIDFAEAMSFRMCEACGSPEGTETKGRTDRKYSRILTLCAKHHKERDSKETFHMGQFAV